MPFFVFAFRFFLRSLTVAARCLFTSPSRSRLPTFIFLGGASRTRTDHLLRARQALYQMSYGPLSLSAPLRSRLGPFFLTSAFRTFLVGLGGLEPPTSPLSGVRSNQLSYKPINTLRTCFLGFVAFAPLALVYDRIRHSCCSRALRLA